MAPSTNPAALTPAELAAVLSACGSKTTESDVAQAVAAGAPSHPDGTIHLIHFAAWLAGQVQ